MTVASKFKISVITCTLNSGLYLEDNLESVWSTTPPPFEQIIVDGYSEDNTLDILQKYQAKWYNIRLVQTPPLGISDAFNTGILASKGNIIQCLNSDDYIINKTIFNTVEEGFKSGIQGLFGSIILVDASKKKISDHRAYWAFTTQLSPFFCPYPHPAMFLAKSVFDTYGLFDVNLKYNMDWDYWIRTRKKIRPKNIENIFCAFRVHTNSISTKNAFTRESLLERIYMLKKYFSGLKLYSIIMIMFMVNWPIYWLYLKKNQYRQKYWPMKI